MSLSRVSKSFPSAEYNANLMNANFVTANLTAANLTGADLSFANLVGATYDEMTICPTVHLLVSLTRGE